MILAAREIDEGTLLEAGICIVGAGPAGIVLAQNLAQAGHEVLLLEAGGIRHDRTAERHLRGSVAEGSRHAEPHLYRRRAIGGTSTIWGGRCVPLDPIDFEERSWVSGSGWPVSWSSVAKYYPHAQAYLGAGHSGYDVRSVLGADAPEIIDGFEDPDVDVDRIERFSPPTNFGRAHRTWLKNEPRVRLIPGATVVRLDASGGPLRMLQVASTPNRYFQVRARRYVLAAGGIEVTRLLMMSDQGTRNGLGNEGGHLGRHYMCHIEATLGRLEMNPADRHLALHFERTDEGVYVRRKLAISAPAQRREQLLNTVFRLHYPLIADPVHGVGILSAMYLLKDAVLPEYQRKLARIEVLNRDRLRRDANFWYGHVANVVRDGPLVTRFGLDWIRRNILARRKLPAVVVESLHGHYPLDVNAEQTPNSDSCITLSTERDDFGILLPHLDWRMSAEDRDSLRRSMLLLRDAIARSGCGRLHLDHENFEAGLEGAAPVGGHHIGTARMALSARDGVVDTNCAVHGVPNLYVASSAVFPTCGHANPTLTILALALRLAEHLHRELSHPSVSVHSEGWPSTTMADAVKNRILNSDAQHHQAG